MIAIINGNIVQEHGVLKDHALLIEKERISDIVPQAELTSMRIEEVYNAYGDISHPASLICTRIISRPWRHRAPAASWIWSWLYMNLKRSAVPMA
ncbi:MAG: hypothetical protein ACLTJG_05870 [[Clostridium] innocuum]